MCIYFINVSFAHENYERHVHLQWVFWNTNDNTILKNYTSTREIFKHMILIFPRICISKLSISISFHISLLKDAPTHISFLFKPLTSMPLSP